MRKIIILGCTGGCLDLLDLINDCNKEVPNSFKVLGFLDDRTQEDSVFGHKILGGFSEWSKFKDTFFVTAIGSEKNFLNRSNIIDSLNIPKEKFINLIHPSALISDYSSLSDFGIVIHSNVIIKTNSIINDFVLLLSSVIVNHDSVIGAYSIINSGVNISGNVIIGRSCYIGAGVTCNSKTIIEDKVLVGSCALTVGRLDSLSVYIGIPAKKIKDLL